MLNSLFPMGRTWDWGTFALYVMVTMIVTALCKQGAIYKSVPKRTSKNNAQWISNACYILAVVILTLLGSLRSYEVGADTVHYVNDFKNATTFGFDWSQLLSFHQLEPGYQLYLMLVRKLSSNYTVLFLITYALVSSAYVRYIRYFFDEHSDYIFLQIFIFYYVSNMSGMRSALGMVFLLPSFIAIDKKKYLYALLLTAAACAFHFTMIFNFFVIIAVWVLRHNNLRKKKWFWFFAIVCVLMVAYFGTYWLKGLLVGTKYEFYSAVAMEDVSLLGSLFYVLFGIVAFIFMRRIAMEGGKAESSLITSFCFLVTYPALFVVQAYRIPNYYVMPRLSIWSKSMEYIYGYAANKETRVIMRILIQVVVLLYLLFRFTRSASVGSFAYILK